MTGHLGSSAIRAGTPQNPLPAVPKELVDQFLAEGGTASPEAVQAAFKASDLLSSLLHDPENNGVVVQKDVGQQRSAGRSPRTDDSTPGCLDAMRLYGLVTYAMIQ